MTKPPFRSFKPSGEIIGLAVMIYGRFPLSFRNVEDLLHERGIDICHENEVRESDVAEPPDKPAALELLNLVMKQFGAPRTAL